MEVYQLVIEKGLCLPKFIYGYEFYNIRSSKCCAQHILSDSGVGVTNNLQLGKKMHKKLSLKIRRKGNFQILFYILA